MTSSLKLLALTALAAGALTSACGGGSSASTTAPTSSAATSSAAQTSSPAAPATTTAPATTSTTTSARSGGQPAHRSHHYGGNSHATSSTSARATTSATATTSSSTTTAPLLPATTPSRAQTLADCHATIASAAPATLTPAETRALNDLCNIAASGNAERVKAAERKICTTIVKASGVPAAAVAAELQTCILETQGLAG